LKKIAIAKKHWPFLFLQRTFLTRKHDLNYLSPDDDVNTVASEYFSHEFTTLEPHLPNNVDKILDIGCGLGVINIFFHEHYNNNEKYYMLDRSDITMDTYNIEDAGGWHDEGGFYSCNKLSATKELLSDHGIKEENIFLIEGNDQKSLEGLHDIDLVVSFSSWGFHYPVHTYLNKVYEVMSKNAVLIIDVRKGTGGIELLKTKFNSIEMIKESNKHIRVECTK
jgi:hypothetical protein